MNSEIVNSNEKINIKKNLKYSSIPVHLCRYVGMDGYWMIIKGKKRLILLIIIKLPTN